MAPEKIRGRILGTVMGGLLCGLLFSRTLAGFVADHFSWRTMFWLGVPLVLVAAALMAAMLPRSGPSGKVQYGAALRSLAHLWQSEPSLRRSTMIQAGVFAAFSAFWAVLALHLQEPPFGLGPGAAGLFGIVGAVGVFAAPLAGRLADRYGPRAVITLGGSLVLFSWLLFAVWDHMAGLVIGVILLDFGVQSAMVSNQHVIYALRPDARNRLNTLFMTGIFTGGAVGSTGAVMCWEAAGWLGVCAFAIGAVSLSMMAMLLTRRS
jgi:predicted MFS family arabinose efflux permease